MEKSFPFALVYRQRQQKQMNCRLIWEWKILAWSDASRPPPNNDVDNKLILENLNMVQL